LSIGRLRASASPVAFENAAVALRLHPEAEEELFHEAAYYDDARLGLGDEFLEHVYRWFDVILDAPHAWPRWVGTPESDTPIRRVVLDRFPHSIAYQVAAEDVVILAVAPAKKRPLYWQSRAGG
jgi:hypothetical protein